MDAENELVAISPRHSVRLGPEYVAFVKRAPRRDFVVRNITRREANGMPLMTADIVIAGEETREKFEAAARYPLHFRKIYFPGRLHGDPAQEFECQRRASEILGIPPPIGHGPDVFRSCFLPGTPYSRLSPLNVDPEEGNLRVARELPLATAAGLWRLAEDAFEQLTRLHEGGLAHGDAELHNFVVCPSPLEIITIDFEASVFRENVDPARWERTVAEDFLPLLREAALLQCALGKQPGPLAELTLNRLDEVFKRPERFRSEIERRSTGEP